MVSISVYPGETPLQITVPFFWLFYTRPMTTSLIPDPVHLKIAHVQRDVTYSISAGPGAAGEKNMKRFYNFYQRASSWTIMRQYNCLILSNKVFLAACSTKHWQTSVSAMPLSKIYNRLCKKENVVARHLFLPGFPPRPSRDLLFPTHVVHM